MRSNLLRSLALLPGLALMTFVWGRYTLSGGFPLEPAFIQNPDALVRLERIRQMMMGGSWFDPVLARVGANDHLVLSWSRPVDALVAGAAWILEHLMAPQPALLLAAAAVSLPLGWAALVGAARIPGLFGERRVAVWGLTALAIAILPFFSLVYSGVGWPDHHGPILLTFILMLLLGWRVVTSGHPLWAWVFGVVQGIGLWISPEMLVTITTVQTGIGLAWVLGAGASIAHQASRAALAFTVSVAAALTLEYGNTMPALALDRLSLFSLIVTVALSAIWAGLAWADARIHHPRERLGIGLAFAGLAAAGIVALVPQVLRGATAHVDPWFYAVWAGSGREGFNLNVTGGLLLSITAAVSGIWLAVRKPEIRHALVYIAPSLILFAGLSWAATTRWAMYSEVCAMPLIVTAFARLWDDLSAHDGGLWRTARVASAVAVVGMATSTIPLAHEHDVTQAPDASIAISAVDQERCDVNMAVERLRRVYEKDGPKLVLAHPNTTPTFLAHTQHRVASVPLFPDAQAVRDTVDLFLSKAKQPSVPPGVDLIVVCSAGPEHIMYDGDPATLHARLGRGADVPGLQAVFPGGNDTDFKIFTVER